MDQRSASLDRGHGHVHHAPPLHASLLRLSVPARLGIAAIGALLLWGALFWALN